MTKKICLDAGHYGYYNQSPCNKAYYESKMNWKLHLLLKKYLEQYGFDVIQTRSDQSKDKGLYERGTCGKGCDLLLSIHSNAVGASVNETVDYPVAYVSINGKGDALGKKLAECVRSVMGTKQKADCWSKKGTKGNYDYYTVIHGATDAGTIGIILEHSFHTNTRSTNWLMDDGNLDKMARAEAKVLAEYFGMDIPEEPEAKVIYRVQVGAYTIKANADAMMAKVKAAGFTDTFMVKSERYYKIQVGAYEVKANADAQLAKVKAAGFSALITTNGGEVVPTNEVETYSHTQFVKDVQTACGAKVDGVAGTETLNKTVTLSAKKNTRHAAVIPVQKRLNALGYTEIGKADGIAGAKFTEAVKHYQKDNGCTSDGEITAKKTTWKKLLGLA